MPLPNVFLSSTYVDLVDVRSHILTCLEKSHFKAVCMERGGISYSHNSPMEYSCYEAVKDCDMMILVIGARYGTEVVDGVSSTDGKLINSITKQEYLQAKAVGMKILTFIKQSVLNEYSTYTNQPKTQRKYFKPTFVDNIAIFQLIKEIKTLNRNNEIVPYSESTEIIDKIEKEIAHLARSGLKKSPENDPTKKVKINAYKLFYYRRAKNLSITELARKVGVKRNHISSLESVKKINHEDINELPFRECSQFVLKKIEQVLGCDGLLSIGQTDDVLSHFVNYYHINRETRKRKDNNLGHKTLDLLPKKAVVFDFDGTLTKAKSRTTWELIWEKLGYTVNDANYYHRQYNNKIISHKEWCKITCEKFIERNCDDSTLQEVARSIELIPGVKELITTLTDNDIEVHIVSGSIDYIIKIVLGDELFSMFTNVEANEFKFRNGKLSDIRGTPHDFEGKATYIKNLIAQRKYQLSDVLFVGNSMNDHWASQSGVSTLCVNPHFTDGNDEKVWVYCIREMDSAVEILNYINFSFSGSDEDDD